TKSMATLSTAYLNALDYARIRKQGPDLAKMADKTAPRVDIIRHPDLRRMLMLQKVFAEGLRAIVLWTAHVQDQVDMRGGHGNQEARPLDALNDFMLPLIKGYGSEKVYELLSLSLQIYGGSGYCQDYPIEQYIRDQKIDTLYEGTTHIQALDLTFRKIARDQGATLRIVVGEIMKLLETKAGGAPLEAGRKRVEEGLAEVQGMLMTMLGFMGKSVYYIGLNANRLLESLSELFIGYLLLDHAVLAQKKLETATGDDVAFYKG